MANPNPTGRIEGKGRKLLLAGGALLLANGVGTAAIVYYFVISALCGIGDIGSGCASGVLYPFTFPFGLPYVSDLLFYLAACTAASLAIFIAFLISVLRTKGDDAAVQLKWWRVVLVLSLLLIVVPVALFNLLIDDSGFSVVPIAASSFSLYLTGSAAQSYLSLPWWVLLGYAINIPFLAGAIIVLAMVARYGIALGQKSYTIRVLFAAVAAVVLLSLASGYSIGAANTAALSGLNANITMYGANMRYLIQNQTAFDALYTGIGGAYSTQHPYNSTYQLYTRVSSISSLINAEYQPRLASNLTSLYGYDWAAYNPIVGAVTMGTIYSLGVLQGTTSLPSTFVTRNSNLNDLYGVTLIGQQILLVSAALGRLFSSGAFGSESYAFPNYTGVSFCGGQDALFTAATTTVDCSQAAGSLAITRTASGWIILMADTGMLNNVLTTGYFERNGTETMPLAGFFYTLALTEDGTYQFNNMLYSNASVYSGLERCGCAMGASLGAVVYQDGHLLVDTGNSNLTGTHQMLLAVDGVQVNYTRYFNWLVARTNLRPGLNNITLGYGGVNGSIGSTGLFVSPFLGLQPSLVSGGLSVKVYNPPGAQPIAITNLSISPNPPAFDRPEAQPSPSITPSGGSSGSFMLAGNESIELNYSVSQGCTIGGDSYEYYMSFNSSRGPGFYAMQVQCT